MSIPRCRAGFRGACEVFPQSKSEPPTFIGSADILRRDLFSRAARAGAKFKVCGLGWAQDCGMKGNAPSRRRLSHVVANQIVTLRSHGPAALFRKAESWVRPMRPAPLPESSLAAAPAHQDEYFRVIREATVCLGVNRVPTARHSNHHPLRYSRLRDIEAPMLGACYLTEWTKGLEYLFDAGVEIETYRTADELSAKLGELNTDPERRRSMRGRAQRRALDQHCVGRSIARISEKLGLTASAKSV